MRFVRARPRVNERNHWAAITTVLALVLSTVAVSSPALAGSYSFSTAPVTYQGPSYVSSVTAGATEDKPQSKLWFHDGSWWALMVSATTAGVNVFELMPDHTWRDTGARVDTRANSTGDALWEGGKLYVASRASDSPGRLIRLSYQAASRTYSVDTDFPVQITPEASESLTIARDTTGRLWATYTASKRVWVTHSTSSDAQWAAPFQPPVEDTRITSDDISSIIAFDGKIGLMWSNQSSHTFRFTTHVDGAPTTAWSQVEQALGGTRMVDDHINMRSFTADEQGRVFVVVKTGQRDDPDLPYIVLLVRARDGSWTSYVHSAVADNLTRPMLVIDEQSRELYVFANGSGKIHYKVTSIDAPQFGGAGRGSEFMAWNKASINDVTAAKSPTSSSKGLIVLASDAKNKRYYHAAMALPSGAPPQDPPPQDPPPQDPPPQEPPGDSSAPTEPGSLRAVAPSPWRVELSWSASTDDVGVTGYRIFRDGVPVETTTSTTWDDVSVAPSIEYAYEVEAFDAAGNTSPRAGPVLVITPSAGQGDGPIIRRGTAFGFNDESTVLTIPVPMEAQHGDVFIASVDMERKGSISGPTGWRLVREDNHGNDLRKATYVRVAGPNEPVDYTWELSRTRGASGVMLAYGGVDAEDPIETIAGSRNPSSTALVAPSLMVDTVGARLVALYGVLGAPEVVPPPDLTGLGTATTTAKRKITTHAADGEILSPGATGEQIAVADEAGLSIGHLLSLRPAP
jgi:hypothetical protein